MPKYNMPKHRKTNSGLAIYLIETINTHSIRDIPHLNQYYRITQSISYRLINSTLDTGSVSIYSTPLHLFGWFV